MAPSGNCTDWHFRKRSRPEHASLGCGPGRPRGALDEADPRRALGGDRAHARPGTARKGERVQVHVGSAAPVDPAGHAPEAGAQARLAAPKLGPP